MLGLAILLDCLIYLGFAVLGVFLTFAVCSFLKTKRNAVYFKDFDSYISVLEYHMIKAYNIIYKDRVMIYSLEATKLDDKEFTVVARDFAALVLTMLGPTLQKELTHLYGNEETLFFNITEYFNTKFEEDEIRKQAVDNLVEQDLEEQK
jgi:hypothetical protein